MKFQYRRFCFNCPFLLKWCSITFIIVFLSSCSLFERRQPQNQIQTRDVPMQARGLSTPLRKRIMVLPFLDDSNTRSKKVSQNARYTVLRNLSRGSRFVIISPDDFTKPVTDFLNENKEYDLKKMAPMAASLGLSALIEGKLLEVRVKRLGDEVGLIRKVKARVETKVRIRVVSAKNGKILLDEIREGEVETSTTRIAEYSYSDQFLLEDPHLIQSAVSKAFSGSLTRIIKAIEKVSWEGRVAMISGERIFINAGRLSGIEIGEILKITEEGEEIFDPDTGLFIGRAPGRMKGTIEVVSYFGKDGAIAIVHSGSGFQQNDHVELY